MFAGPNGSGKSTLFSQHRLFSDFGRWLNADEIAATLVGDPTAIAVAAQEQVRRAREDAIAERADYCFETVMSHPSHLEHLQEAKRQGYFVNLVYVAIDDPRANVSRVALRVTKGGHDVPPDRIVQRWHRSIAQLPAALAIADAALIYDNSDAAAPFRLIASKADGMVSLATAGLLPRWFGDLLPQLTSDPRP